ncbi:wax ester synthase/diacylglycerol acyltransferase 4-like isoform X2 [Diospyros lotus]|uniref:wax ester synthase/diacylglycerol acyltransferase 4-like isoform X2 n=1 Tax=Diospyros lotus TaxID=55363 RepID=UPI00224DBDB7|nr:wax ester synthase/diacylglycerol acyltransferase 4-like isoform X2 [Diospyros lotus]
MNASGTHIDEPVTPAGRLFLQQDMLQVIHCIIRGTQPIDLAAVRSELADSVMIKHPRFCSLMVRDRHGREHWRKTEIDLDQHLIVLEEPVGEGGDEQAVNDYVADLSVSSPLSPEKPLWEIHVLRAHKCAVFRLHHALGDGVSLMSMLLAGCRQADRPDERPSIVSGVSKVNNGGGGGWGLGRVVSVAWWTVVFVVQMMLRTLWVRDRRTAVSGGEGVELWPRKLVTAKFRLDHMKAVKKAVPAATINDVLLGIVSSGLSRYLHIRSPKALPEGLQITGLAMVNLRTLPRLQDLPDLMRGNSGLRWGNKFGIVLLPVHYHPRGDDPLQHVKRAKKMIDRKKQSLEAHFSYRLLNFLIACFGAKAITMHMMSYAGRAEMQILVAKDIIPDPEVLARCFEDALLEMKEAAGASRLHVQ